MMSRRIALLWFVPLALLATRGSSAQDAGAWQAAVERYCVSCHGDDEPKGELNLSKVLAAPVEKHAEVWEEVVRRLQGRQMPPPGKRRPTEDTYVAILGAVEGALDRSASEMPNPGRTETLRRLTRTEYQNAVRDLLALDIDAAAFLPPDEASHGFDNVTVGNLSPTLLDRYVSAAQRISRLAVGTPQRTPGGDTFRLRPDITQEHHVEGLPFGTRGGAVFRYTFPRDGEYELQVRLARDRNEEVEGIREPHELVVLLDKEQVQSFTVKPPTSPDHSKIDAHLKARITVKAGPRDVGVTFLKNPASLVETTRQPYNARFNMHRHPRLSPAIYQVSITGPFEDQGVAETPSRKRIFVSRPAQAEQEEASAKHVLATIMRRAYRRTVKESDLERILPFYREGREDGGFEAGIEAALSAILVSREFLFRVEQDPSGVASKTAYEVGDLELASRLSFFLWSSIPDDELLASAEKGELRNPDVLSRHAKRMLADPRANSLVTSFASQWLHLRNLDSITPDGRLFPDFDDNLRQAFRRETELLFEEVLSKDQSIVRLLKSDHAWLNERLAKHYGVPNVYGTHFRPVTLDAASHRGGLLRHGSVLTVTSYATRTSPVLRGKWILENIVGTPPKPPPPNVPSLDDNTVSATLPMRQKLAKHRESAACASCHNAMDPVGFSMENYDAVGRFRLTEDGAPVDSSGGLPDGSAFDGIDGLEEGLLRRPDVFATTLTEKLMTFALGRGVEYYDAPAVRRVVRTAKDHDYRFSSLVVGIVTSTPFRMRTTP